MCTVEILNFPTDMFWANSADPVQTALKEQSDQGLHCLLFYLHNLRYHILVCPLYLNFRTITAKFSVGPKFWNFTVFGTARKQCS